MGFFSGISKAFSSVAKVAAPLLGGAIGAVGQERTNASNIAQSKAQMDFQERMSNTSYQRGVSDLRKAGLNPMLAYSQGGASTPGGTKADIGNVTAAGINAATSAAQLQNTQSQTRLNETTAQKTAAETDRIKSETLPVEQNAQKMWSEIDRNNSVKALNSVTYNKVQQEVKNAIETNGLIKANTNNTQANKLLTQIKTKLEKTYLAGAKNTERFDETTGSSSTLMKTLVEFLKLMNQSRGKK